MGLFDFLKSNKPAPQTPETPAPATPGAASSAPAETPAPGGPRYKGSSYTSPTPASPAPIPQMPPMPMPQMPIPELPSMPHFEPVNVLEQLLFNAATMPEFRPGFYQALLNEEVFVVTIPKEGEPLGEVTPVEGMEIQLQVLNDGKIPVFTSKERIFESGTEQDSLPYMRLRGLDFFQMVQGADCALNPFSTVGKMLPANEIAELLSSSIMQGPPGGNMQVTLGPATEAHMPLIEAIQGFAQSKPQIETAHVALVRFQDETTPPRLLLAFYTDDNDPAFLEEMGPVVQGKLKEDDLVDVMVLDKNSDEPLNQYFLQAIPVYTRTEV
ncbi:enhanced serine sensitivity protein SseB C-terminal domain-containing protein [Hymenobacter cellulosivorans]|uniref:Enhanced serine sensitivity protein SseB C-terminal domain-containing protein n=1 Tax=Hymenobacter cellulosivorans TaxID=2932249 RepID=A0ABY4F7U5_9BACT|nr:enhanced serine sensitivity protein SseB C-terminal domain-containing protein [Hymenobacter cellulosivorans]UOQ51989.1 enhanced serine sensitivity protein SseB C-terminal domain-containing protein [Hymenobacter cellulosivorans]